MFRLKHMFHLFDNVNDITKESRYFSAIMDFSAQF